MRRRRVLLILALAAAAGALPRRRRLRWPSRRRRKKMWTLATRRAARSLEASVSEVRDLLLSARDRRDLAGNALAGLASAVAVVPEASQFALIAGAPLPLVESHGVEAMRVAVFVAGLLQLAVGLLGGRLVRMVPQPVVLGFVNGLAVKVLRAQVDHFQPGGRRPPTFPHGTWLAGVPLLCHGALAALSFAVIEGAPARLTRASAPLLAMGLCSRSPGGARCPCRSSRTSSAPSTAAPSRSAWRSCPATTRARRCPGSGAPSRALVAAALPCAVELAAVGLLQSLLTLQLVDGLTRDGPDGRGRASRVPRSARASSRASAAAWAAAGCWASRS
ncbi:secondary active sulfate transmembrane transporter [Aureococcus anophagefferens]|nr:secondary active sulfate transmembrane transporter [Aureococcus anophagefferens]